MRLFLSDREWRKTAIRRDPHLSDLQKIILLQLCDRSWFFRGRNEGILADSLGHEPSLADIQRALRELVDFGMVLARGSRYVIAKQPVHPLILLARQASIESDIDANIDADLEGSSGVSE